MHWFRHQLPIAWENAVKPIEKGETGKFVPILSAKYGYFSFIRFLSYDILYHVRNAQLSPSISNSTGKFSKIHPVTSPAVFQQY